MQSQVIGAPVHQEPACRTAASPSSPLRGHAAVRRLWCRRLWSSVRGLRRDGDDLAGQRERAVLQNVAQGDRARPRQQVRLYRRRRCATRQLQQDATATAGMRNAAADRQPATHRSRDLHLTHTRNQTEIVIEYYNCRCACT